jgi:hypothetical protein
MMRRPSEDKTEMTSQARMHTVLGLLRKDLEDLLKLFP